jgi:protein-tyrosine-phosphatase
MAAALLRAEALGRLRIDSAGVHEGGLDPFVEIVLAEVGVGLAGHEPKAMAALDLSQFDLIVALTPEAAGEIRRSQPRDRIEFWDVDNPSEARGGRAEALAAYRAVREDILRRLRARFPEIYQKS